MKHLLHSTYIALGRMTATQDARGAIHSRGYDALGRVAWESDPATNGTWYAYDALGRRTAVTNTLGEVTHTAYDLECKECCPRTGQYEESPSAGLSLMVIGVFGSRRVDLGPAFYQIGWYGRISGSGSISAKYDVCKMEGSGSGCITVSGEAGGIATVGANVGFAEVSGGGRAGAGISGTACLNCNAAGCKVRYRGCVNIAVRVWAKAKVRSRSWEVFHEEGANWCSEWKEIAF